MLTGSSADREMPGAFVVAVVNTILKSGFKA
jgi:hypothetical protein